MTRRSRGCASAAIACVASFGIASTAHAERYALLVGVSHYAATAAGADIDLEGPIQDVPALRRVLIERQGFQDRNIVVLVDQAATKRAILDRLAERVSAMRDGDYLLFYFSGHGTSAFDGKMRPVGAFIGPNSGALAPQDLRIDSAESAAESLIIGRRDLRPILERVPKGAQAMVILDACYSENSMRTIRQRLPGKTRGITLSTLLPQAESPRGAPIDDAALTATAEAERQYPYLNVSALTAASKDEQAMDIDSRRLAEYPTLDGRPHGAFTNSLLEGLSGAGDGDHDGTLTLQELYEFSRRSVQSRFSHTPQLLTPASARTAGPLFGTAPQAPAPSPTPCQAGSDRPSPRRVRVRLDGLEPAVSSRIRGVPDLEVVAQTPDLVIASAPGGPLELYDASGSLVRQFRAAEVDALIARAKAEPALERFVTFRTPCQTFNVTLLLRPDGQARFSQRDRMGVEASLDRDAYLVLFNIDKAGTVSVIYPAVAAERGRKSAGQPLPMAMVRAIAPFGSEHLKLVAFRDAPPLEQFGCVLDAAGAPTCSDLQPGTAPFAASLAALEHASGTAESHIRFTTYED